MCVYCNMGDTWFRRDTPWTPDPWPQFVPQPANPAVPVIPWDLDKLREYHDLLKRVKEMEDKLGCPCEPNKADYLKMFEDRIKELERKLEGK